MDAWCCVFVVDLSSFWRGCSEQWRLDLATVICISGVFFLFYYCERVLHYIPLCVIFILSFDLLNLELCKGSYAFLHTAGFSVFLQNHFY